jgi:nucleoid-associated protein YgaU
VTTRPSSSARLHGLLATVGILSILVGMPLVMLALGYEPIPHHIPDWSTLKHDLFSRDDGTLALQIIKVVAWLAWLTATVLILLEVLFKVGRIRTRHVPLLGKPQGAARYLVASAALLFIGASAIGNVSAARAAPLLNVVSTTTHSSSNAQVAADHQPTRTHRQAQPTFDYTVREGDNLWDLAKTYLEDGSRYHELVALNRHIVGNNPGFLEQGWVLKIPDNGHTTQRYVVQQGDTLQRIASEHLGAADRWAEIFDASSGITQPDGHHLTNPDLILPGYIVNVPQQRADFERSAPAAAPAAPGQQAPSARAATPPPATPAQPPEPRPSAEPSHRDASSAPHSTRAPTGASDFSTKRGNGDDTDTLSAPWVVQSLAGGAILSAALLIALSRRRRNQFRARRPGRAVAVPPPELAPYEKTMLVAGHPMEKAIDFLDAVLRHLAFDVAAASTTAPPVAAVELTEGFATLHLTEPADLPEPWSGSADKLRWTATSSSLDGASPYSAPAPFPLLATIGRDDNGHWWLLNLEHLGTITIGGDTDHARDLLRYIACELALAPWADSARIDAVGIGREAARMDSTRTRYHATDVDAADIVLASALEMVDRVHGLDTDAPTGRSTQVDDELWLARLFLIDAVHTDGTSLQRLIALIADHPDRTGASVVLADRDLAGGFALDLSADGRLRVAQAGLDLIPVGITQEAAEGSAQVLEQSQNLADVEVPVDDAAVDGWEAYTDGSGGIRREYTLTRNGPKGNDEPARTLLGDLDQVYEETAAVTKEDLEQVAPRVPINVCEAVEAADPTLDEDYEAWVTQDPTRPRIHLLGPVKVTAYGDMREIADRVGFYTELVAYLTSKSRYGATTDEVVEAFGYKSRDRVRIDMTIARSWLGSNPRTGMPFLPKATAAPAKRTHGKNVYQLDTGAGGVMVDTDLFLRKKKRAQARGEEGIPDLRQALALVDGVPFSRLRDGGWSWLFEGDRLDHQAARSVSDCSHILTTHYLSHDEVEDALTVARIGLLAAPYEDTMQLNLARVMRAEGRPDEAERFLNESLFNRSDDGLAPRDPSERTKKIISTWKATG